jgi:hypothetical protein
MARRRQYTPDLYPSAPEDQLDRLNDYLLKTVDVLARFNLANIHNDYTATIWASEFTTTCDELPDTVYADDESGYRSLLGLLYTSWNEWLDLGMMICYDGDSPADGCPDFRYFKPVV